MTSNKFIIEVSTTKGFALPSLWMYCMSVYIVIVHVDNWVYLHNLYSKLFFCLLLCWCCCRSGCFDGFWRDWAPIFALSNNRPHIEIISTHKSIESTPQVLWVNWPAGVSRGYRVKERERDGYSNWKTNFISTSG